jgi:nitrite reductase/ring-hydroxylating ferredoxin subunit
MSDNGFKRVASLADIPRGKAHCITADGVEILLCHTAEGLFAVDNLCTHAAARMSEGKLKGCRILCPLHGAAFDVRDGAVLSRPAREALRSYPVKVQGDDVYLALAE